MCEAHVGDAIRKQLPEARKVSASAGKGEARFLLENELPKPMLEHELHRAIDPLGYKLLSVAIGEPEERLFSFRSPIKQTALQGKRKVYNVDYARQIPDMVFF